MTQFVDRYWVNESTWIDPSKSQHMCLHLKQELWHTVGRSDAFSTEGYLKYFKFSFPSGSIV